jgi:DAK2 domain fusion protein YloV
MSRPGRRTTPDRVARPAGSPQRPDPGATRPGVGPRLYARCVTGPGLLALDGSAYRRWCLAGRDALGAARASIDALNVFPVADGDTGTNLLLTMQAVVEALPTGPAEDLPATVRVVADAALRGARGSSGVILSQVLRGLADVLAAGPTATGADLRTGLSKAADAAWAAIANPVEGTMLSVARAAATAAAAADRDDLRTVAAAAVAGARVELSRTTSQLAPLAVAGVVDAGGAGLVVLLGALADVASGVVSGPIVGQPAPAGALISADEAASEAFGYEVQYLLDADDEAASRLRERLLTLGDAVAVVGGCGLHNVHVHVNDVGAAVEAGVEAGRPHHIVVTRFADQITDGITDEICRGSPQLTERSEVEGAAGVRVIAVTPAGGLADLFRSAGACVVAATRDDGPTTHDLLAAIRSSCGDHVVVLPNSREMRVVADAAADLARVDGSSVIVVPTRSPVQGLAALAVHDDRQEPAVDAVTMSAAAAATRYAAVTIAVSDALTSAGPCRTGDVLGLIDDDVLDIGSEVGAVARGLLDRMLDSGGDLVTLVVGAGADATLGGVLAAHVSSERPAVEVVRYAGGQPHYPVLIGVE